MTVRLGQLHGQAGAERDVVRGLYPKENVAAFLECKRRFDPAGVFSNAYTRRVLGV